MELSTSDPRVKTQLFRFVDVLPVLKTEELKREHLIEYLSRPKGTKKWPLSLRLISSLLKWPLLSSWLVRVADNQVQQMGNLFIIGRTAHEVLPKLEQLRFQKTAFTLDILGEAVLSDLEAKHYREQYFSLIDILGERSKSWPTIDQIDLSPLGPIPKVNISIKVSALDALSDPTAFEPTLERLEKEITPIIRKAVSRGIFINFDMEQFALKELTMELFRRILFHPEFRNYRHLGIVNQAYLKSSLEDLRSWIELARERGTPFTIRLVKGAYWDYESILAQQNDWPSPVFEEKWQSDQNFEACARELLMAYPAIELAAGSHNVRSLSYVMALTEKLGLPKNAIELQMLYGMSGTFKAALVQMGYRLREYCPVGEMLPGLSYLVRRLLENTANDSFLRQSLMDKKEIGELLQAPRKRGM